MNVDFIRLGTQLITVGSDSLLKLWNINDGECINTFENHEDRIWALETSADNSLVYTGSSDSTICIWKDVTEEETIKQQEAELQSKLKTEDLTLYLRKKDYKNALIIAMDLDHPMKLLKIFQDVQLLQEMNSISGSVSVDQYLQDLNVDDVCFINLAQKTVNVHQRLDQSHPLHTNCSISIEHFAQVSLSADGIN